MQPIQVVVTVTPHPNGTAQLNVGSNPPVDRDTLLRVLSQGITAVVSQPEPPVIETASPGQIAGLLNGHG